MHLGRPATQVCWTITASRSHAMPLTFNEIRRSCDAAWLLSPCDSHWRFIQKLRQHSVHRKRELDSLSYSDYTTMYYTTRDLRLPPKCK